MHANGIKKAVVLISVLTAFVLLVTGCSGSGSGKPFSQEINAEGVHIWYECQNKIDSPDEEESYIIEDVEEPEDLAAQFGRETRVVWIKVYQEGKLSSYSCLEDVNLGHFSKMTDEEIIAELADEEKYLCGQKDQPYQIYMYTDAAGQEVIFEGVPALIKQSKDDDPMYFMSLFSKDKVPAFQVYDSYYGGYALYNYDETMFSQACIVTRCKKSAVYGLDNMNLEDAVLDYKTPEEMLNEFNTTLKEEQAAAAKAEKTAKTPKKAGFDIAKGITEEMNDATGEKTVSTDHFTVTLPGGASWIYEVDDKTSITFYNKAAHEGEFGGRLFSIQAFEPDDESYDPMPFKIVGEIAGKKIVATYPSDVQYDFNNEAAKTEYMEVYEAAQKISDDAKTSPLVLK